MKMAQKTIAFIDHQIRLHRAKYGNTAQALVINVGDSMGYHIESERTEGYYDLEFMKVVYELGAEVVYVLGNHEFDYYSNQTDSSVSQKRERAQRIIGRLTRFSKKMSKLQGSDWYFLGANLTLGEDGKRANFVRSYQDLTIDGKKTRIVGLVTEDFISKSNIESNQKNHPVRLFESVVPLVRSAKSQLLKAARNGVEQVILAIHESTTVNKELLEKELVPWIKSRPEFQNNRGILKGVTGGHSHEVHILSIPQPGSAPVTLWEAGSQYEVMSGIWEENGTISTLEHWDHKKIRRFNQAQTVRPSKETIQFIRETNGELEYIYTNYKKIILISHFLGLPITKKDFKNGPQEEGKLFGGALKSWGEQVIESTEVAKRYPKLNPDLVLGLFSSSALRIDSPIYSSSFSYYDLRTLTMVDSVRLFEMTGHHAKELILSFMHHRLKKDGAYGFQFDQTTRVDLQNNEVFTLQNGKEVPIETLSSVVIAIDSFIAENPYQIEKWVKIFRSATPIVIQDTPSFDQMLLDHFVPLLREYNKKRKGTLPSNCPGTFSRLIIPTH